MKQPQRGFTYLWLLFALALGGAVLAQIGQHWSGRMQRERERELIFRGAQIASAIAAYNASQAVAAPAWPRSFDELTEDRRSAALQRHLRQAYSDPFTGKADWVPLLDTQGGWRGVRSRSDAPALLPLDAEAHGRLERVPRVSDRLFEASRYVAKIASQPAPAASQPAGPGADSLLPK